MSIALWLCLAGLCSAVLASAAPSDPPSVDLATDASSATVAPKQRAKLDSQLFPVPAEIQPNVDLWTKVYTQYDNSVVLIHDDLHMEVIYAALDFSEIEGSGISAVRKERLRRDNIRQAKDKFRSILGDLAAGRTSSAYADDQRRVKALFADVPGGRSKFSSAAERVRHQTCLRNRFAEAIERSGHYMPAMERIFKSYGLPTQLTRLPFVESLFQLNARSSAAAGGIWQFMPATGKLYLAIGAEVDERYDPLRATDAAARHLKGNFDRLQSWPVAITGYNHGRAGMARAVRTTGTRDIGTIVRTYKSRTFGFASRNFYAEFVAAYLAYENRHIYFPDAEPLPPLAFDEFAPPAFVSLPQLVAASDSDLSDIQLLNPGLSRQLWAGELYLPKSYSLRVPEGQGKRFSQAFSSLSNNATSSHQVGVRYKVRRGDTLGVIARRHGTSVSKIKAANGLRGHLIRVGQTLLIPPRGGSVATSSRRSSTPSPSRTASAPSSKPPSSGYHTVRRGESLSAIATSYGTSTRALQVANGIRSANLVKVGQRLRIPDGKGATHKVRRGDTLGAIATRYGTSVRAIQRANRMKGHVIRPGQLLVIP